MLAATFWFQMSGLQNLHKYFLVSNIAFFVQLCFKRCHENQIKLNQTHLQVIRCDEDTADSSDPPQFKMNEEMGEEELIDEDDDDDWSEEDDMSDEEDVMGLDEEPFQIDQSLNLPISQSTVQVEQLKN